MWWRTRREKDLDDEIKFHLTQETQLGAERGATHEEAAHGARRAFGSIALAKDATRDVWRGNTLEQLLPDIRFGARLLSRSPVFTLFAVTSLALGIAATSAIFALFDRIVLRELPVPEPSRLVSASFGRPGGNFNYNLPYPQFAQIRDRNTTLDGVFAMSPFGRVNVAVRGQLEVAVGQYVSGSYYETLGLRPALGRLLATEDDRPSSAVAVISHAYWQRRFGGSREILGAGITLNQVPFTIVGVEQPGFIGIEVGRLHDISVPMRASNLLRDGAGLWDEAFSTWIVVMGRLKAGVSLAFAERELNGLFRQASLDGARSSMEARFANESVLKLEPGARGTASGLRESYERSLELVLMLLGAVLLLSSLNVATLLLSRAEARQKEIATRMAIGAGRLRIVRQLLTEAMILAVLAGTVGLGLAWWGSRGLLRIALPAADRLPVDLSPDLRVAAFTVAISGLTCLLFGLVPAWRATSRYRLAGLTTARQIGGGRRRRLLDRGLVASQVALSLALIVTAGLFLRSLGSLWARETGYDRTNVLMFSVEPKLASNKALDLPNAYRSILHDLRAVPGARSVSLSSVRPVSDSYYFISVVTTINDRILGDNRVRVAYNDIAPGYFATLGIPLLAGRDFDDRDLPNNPKVVIVSERMARHFSGSPIGQRITMARSDVREVVGVAKDVRYASVKDAPREVIYMPIFQSQPKDLWYAPTFEIRYAGRTSEILDSIRGAVTRADAGLTPVRVKTLETQTRESLSRERLLAILSSYIGGFALLLACIGLYGLMNYAVTQRTPEIGVRLALGATPAAVRRLVTREGMTTALFGLIAGLALCSMFVGIVRTQLFDVQPLDPSTFISATLLLLAVAWVAAYLPGVRASRTEPLNALRHE